MTDDRKTPTRRQIHIAVHEDVSRTLTTIAHDGHVTISEVVELLVEGSSTWSTRSR